MKYLIGALIGLVAGIILYILWKKIFKKYLPLEDSLFLRFICSSAYYIAGIINGVLFATMNIYAISTGLILLFIIFAISYGFGLYYKVLATKKRR
ncbi:hypothetical protein [Treponema sp.]|uniref:hypothetical protein n=1 Tax=Treponema sp. TaxID=166 RepID=UPI003F040496